MLSASKGHLEVVKILIEHGAELNIQSNVSHYRPQAPPTTCMQCMYVYMRIRDISCVYVKRFVDMYVQ